MKSVRGVTGVSSLPFPFACGGFHFETRGEERRGVTHLRSVKKSESASRKSTQGKGKAMDGEGRGEHNLGDAR